MSPSAPHGRACRPATAAPQAIPDEDPSSVALAKEEKPFDLPKGWAWCRLGEIFKFIDYRGKTPTKINSGIPLITARNVRMGYIDYTIRDFISEDEFSERKSRGVARKGDVLFTTEAPLGYVALADLEEFSTGQRLICFQQHGSNELFSNKLITFFLQSSSWQKVLFEHKTGTTVAGIKAEYLKQLPIPLPPLAEQKRIVAKVEALLKDVEKYERAVEGLTGAADDLSKKILDLAIRGQLTKRDPKDEPADKLLQRIWEGRAPSRPEGRGRSPSAPQGMSPAAPLGRACRPATAAPHSTRSPRSTRPTQPPPIPDDEKPFALPKGWAWCRLGDVFDHNTGKALNRNDSKGCMREYITTSNVYWDHFELSVLKKMPIEKCELDRFSIKKGDLLVCEGGDIGRANIWQSDQTVCFQNHIHRLRPYVSVEIRFFYYVFRLYKATGRIKGKGIGMLGLSANALHNMLIPLPPLAEQKRIVAKVEELLSEIERLKKGAA